MKSIQDLTVFLRELSKERDKQCVILIYPDKSFDIQEYTAESNTLESIYQSDGSGSDDMLDINDLCYEDAEMFSEHIEELAKIASILTGSNDPNNLDNL